MVTYADKYSAIDADKLQDFEMVTYADKYSAIDADRLKDF